MDKKRLSKIFFNFLLLLALFYVVFFGTNSFTSKSEITYNEFLSMIDEGKVDSVEIGQSQIKIIPIGENKEYYTKYVEYDSLVDKLYEADVDFEASNEGTFNFSSILLSIILNFGPLVFFFFIINKLVGGKNGNGIFNAGKSNAKLNINKNTGITFADVAGQEEAKEQLTEIIDFLHNPKKYQEIGAKIPKGALLVGPPGTGKTLMAKAVAGEANVPFFSVTGSEFIEMYVGVGASRIRDLFEQAKQHAPCIIFIDEVDSIAKTRDSGSRSGTNDEREQTLNQLLAEMDGFDSSKGIIILAATNRPESLDKAFLRAGRFDRKIIVEKPDFRGRVETLKVHSKNVKLSDDVNFDAIAYATTGSVGADLENIVNEAALRAVKLGRKMVCQEDLMEAVETVFAGKEKKDRVMSDKEKRLVAYHEVGHATIAAMQKNSSPVQKITIVPRTKGSLGYTLQIPEEEKFLSSKEDMINEIKTLLGGRCAEEVVFNTITTGASNDIERATEIATQMITIYGMSDKFDMMALESVHNIYLDMGRTRNCSEQTSTEIDKEVLNIIRTCHEDAKNIIKDNIPMIDEVVEYLLKKESITGDEFMAIFRKYYPETTPETTRNPRRTKLRTEKKESEIKDVAKNVEPKELALEKETETKKPEFNGQEDIVKEETYPTLKDDKKEQITQETNTEKEIQETEENIEVKEEKPIVIAAPPKKEELQKEEAKKEEQKEEKLPKPIRIDRPSASVLGPQKQKQKKNKNKATATDMKNLLDSVQKEKKKKLYEESVEESKEEPKQEQSNDDIDDITEDMF